MCKFAIGETANNCIVFFCNVKLPVTQSILLSVSCV